MFNWLRCLLGLNRSHSVVDEQRDRSDALRSVHRARTLSRRLREMKARQEELRLRLVVRGRHR